MRLRSFAANIATQGSWALRVATRGTTQPPTPRSREAMRIVRRYTAFSLPTAFVPVPLADICSLVMVQMLMLRRIARHYRVPFAEQRARLAIASLLLGAPQALSGELAAATVTALPIVKHIPGIGTIAGGIASALLWSTGTWALGLVFVDHFESGGTLIDFDPEANRAAFERQLEAEAARQLKPRKGLRLPGPIRRLSLAAQRDADSAAI